MNRTTSITAVLVCVLGFGVSAPALAQLPLPYLSHSSNIQVNPDGNSGWSGGNVNGERLFATSISSGVGYRTDPCTGDTYIDGNVNISGMFWNNPNLHHPLLNLRAEHPLETHANLELTELQFNGQWFDLHDVVSINLSASAGIWRDFDFNTLNGYLNMNVNFQGAVPLSSWINVQIYDPNHGPDFPDWQVSYGTQGYVTSGFTPQTPAPGGAASLITAGVAVLARRRRR